MADIANKKYFAIIADPVAQPTYPATWETAEFPVNPPSTSGGNMGGIGTPPKIAIWTSENTLGDSAASDDGTTFFIDSRTLRINSIAVVNELNIENLPASVGPVSTLGRDSENNVVENGPYSVNAGRSLSGGGLLSESRTLNLETELVESPATLEEQLTSFLYNYSGTAPSDIPVPGLRGITISSVGDAASLQIYADAQRNRLYTRTKTTLGYSSWEIISNKITGTENFVPKFKALSGLEPSNIFDNGTRVGIFTDSPIYPVHILKETEDIQFVVETEGTNRAATNNALTDGSGVSIASFGSTYTESGISRWAGRSGLYINTGKPNQTLNLWIGSRAILNALPTGETAIGNSDPEAWLHVQGDLKIDTVLEGEGDIAIIDANNVVKRITTKDFISNITKAYQDTQVTVTGVTKSSLLSIDEGSLSFTTEDMAVGSRYKGELIITNFTNFVNDHTLFLNLGGQEVSISVPNPTAFLILQGILRFSIYFRGGIDSARTFSFKGDYIIGGESFPIPWTQKTIDSTTDKVFDLLWKGDDVSNEATLIDFELIRR